MRRRGTVRACRSRQRLRQETVRPIHTVGSTESRNQQGVDRWQQGRAYAARQVQILRVEPYIDCHRRASAERGQAPRKIFERGALWQYKG